jgi:hypothetical protein
MISSRKTGVPEESLVRMERSLIDRHKYIYNGNTEMISQ